MSREPTAGRPSPPASWLIVSIQAYRRWLSPNLPARCRFLPTCSEYAVQALRDRGAVVGLALSARRLLRCHPFHPGGYDPVPRLSRRNGRRRVVECGSPPSGVVR